MIENVQKSPHMRGSGLKLDGVEFDLIHGAQCPMCKSHLKKMPGKTTTNVLPWADGVRVRYHTCRRCGARFKSIET